MMMDVASQALTPRGKASFSSFPARVIDMREKANVASKSKYMNWQKPGRRGRKETSVEKNMLQKSQLAAKANSQLAKFAQKMPFM